MSRKAYAITIYAVTAVCVLLTIMHLIYAINAYQHSSIIEFVSRELWWL